MIFGQSMFQVSASFFRVLSIMYKSGVSYEGIIGFYLALTAIIWFRTIVLLPVGWIRGKENMNLYKNSPLGAHFRIKSAYESQKKAQKLASNSTESGNFRETALSFHYILLVTWITAGNLVVVFTAFTWGQYSRYVDDENYEQLVGNFGSYAWSAAIFRYNIINIKASDFRLQKLIFKT